jgi:hypothetical protein
MYENPHYLQEMRQYLKKTANTSRPVLYHDKKSLRCEACWKAEGQLFQDSSVSKVS